MRKNYKTQNFFSRNYEDIFSFPFSEIRPDGNYYGVLEGPTFFTKVLHIYHNNELIKLDLPLKMDIYGTYKNLLIISIAQEWHRVPNGYFWHRDRMPKRRYC